MKYLLIILLFVSGAAIGQRVYSPSVDGVPGRNQPVGISGQPLDGRNQYHDTTISPAKWRDFQSTAEALAYFNTATKRQGGFEVFVHSGGTLSAGVWTGGVRTLYYWKDGVTDGDLVAKIPSGGGTTPTFAVDSATTRGATHVALYGNSLGYGTGGSQTVEYPDGVPWAEYLKNLSGYDVVRFAVPGQSSTQIKDRFLADLAAHPERAYWGYIFEMGTNNSGSPTQVKADIATCVAALTAVGNTRYLVMGIPGLSDPVNWSGTGGYTNIVTLNNDLATIYGVRFVNVRAALTALPAGATHQDSLDNGHDIPLTRWMYPSDVVHYNDQGYQIWAATTNAKMYLLKPSGSSQVALGTGSVLDMFNNAPPISTRQLSSVRSVFGYPSLRYDTYTDANGYANPMTVDVKGSLRITNTRGNASQEAGIVFRDYLTDFGGKSLTSLTGTNVAYWSNPAYGFFPYNNMRGFSLGSLLDHVGDYNHTGNTTESGQHKQVGNIYSQGLFIGDPVTYTARRPFDISQSGNGWMPATLTQSQIDSKGGSGTLISEMVWNSTTNHLMAAKDNSTGYGLLKQIAYNEDITGAETKAIGGPGVLVLGSGTTADPYKISNTQLPPEGKLYGTLFNTIPVQVSNPPAYALDSNLSTYYTSYPFDVKDSNYIGLRFDTARVVTRMRVFPADGLEIAGSKIQGSNTSDSTGYTTIFTIPNDIPYYQWSEYPISTTTAYKHLRILQRPGAYVQAIKEIEFYGYKPTPAIIVTSTGTSGPATLVGSTLNIPQYSGGGGGSTDTSSLSRRIDSSYAQLSRRIDSAYNKTFGLSDSSGFALGSPNGRRDTTIVLGVSGGSSGGGSGTLSNFSANSASPLFTTSVATSTTTPALSFFLNNTTPYTLFGRGSGTGQPSYVSSLDSNYVPGLHTEAYYNTKYGAGGGLTQPQVSALVHDSLGPTTTFRNAQKSGHDTLTRAVGNTIITKGFVITDGTNTTASKLVTDTSITYAINVTAPLNSGEDVIPITDNYTISLSNGLRQNIVFSGSATGKTVSASNSSTFDGMVLHIYNGGTNSLTIFPAMFQPDGVNGVTFLLPGKWMRAVKRVNDPTKWWITSFN